MHVMRVLWSRQLVSEKDHCGSVKQLTNSPQYKGVQNLERLFNHSTEGSAFALKLASVLVRFFSSAAAELPMKGQHLASSKSALSCWQKVAAFGAALLSKELPYFDVNRSCGARGVGRSV